MRDENPNRPLRLESVRTNLRNMGMSEDEAREAGHKVTGCDAGAKGVPTFTETKEVKTVTVKDGVIVETFSTGVGKDIDGLTATFTPTLAAGAANVTWNVTTTVANDTAKTALTKNNVGP